MQCNALNIKTAVKEVWLYFISRTRRSRYAGSTTNLQIVLKTPQNPYLNEATKKILAKFARAKQRSRNETFQT